MAEIPNEIIKKKIDADTPPTHVFETEFGNLYMGVNVPSPEALVAIEDFAAGDTLRWRFWHTEVHFILKGKAEITYTLGPWHDEKKTFSIEAGDCYVIPRAAELEFKVSPEGPLRKFCVVMPKDPIYDIRPKKFRRLAEGELKT